MFTKLLKIIIKYFNGVTDVTRMFAIDTEQTA